MTDELIDIVNAMLPIIEGKLNVAPSTLKLWFGDLVLVSLSEKNAVFTTPSPLRQTILRTKYFNVIKESLEEVIGFPVDVDIKVAESAPRFTSGVENISQSSLYSTESQDVRPKEDEEDREDTETIMSEIINGPAPGKKSLLDEYTFENFVEGSSNKFAKALCYAVAREPTSYNPLFIYGHSGLGKTHLLYAVINYMKKNHPHLKIVYKKCETFLDELVKAIKDGDTASFKERYRTADVLLIDDIQFIAGKEQTQEEFFHTFSALYESEKQIILASDRPPKDINPLEERLRSRFEGGPLADVQPPSYELRVAIIKKKADYLGINIPNDLVEYMAERLHRNIRQIEGVLKRLYAVYSLTSAEVTKEKIDEVISIIDPGNIPTDTMVERILSAVSRNYGISIEDMKSKRKTEDIANARHVAIHIIKHITPLTLKQIGAIFGRDHTTVLSSLSKVERNIKTINNYEAEIQKVIKEIKVWG